MEKLKGVKIRYSSPAINPQNISLNLIYTIGFDGKLYIDDGNRIQYMTLELIKMYFSPIKTSWEEILKDNRSKEPKENN